VLSTNRMSGNQAHGTHHTGSGGYQNDTHMEENAHKWQIERDNDPDIKEAVSGTEPLPSGCQLGDQADTSFSTKYYLSE
jgi:hypothetical protein